MPISRRHFPDLLAAAAGAGKWMRARPRELEMDAPEGPVTANGVAIYEAPGAKTVLMTHARRDVLWAAGEAELVAPEGLGDIEKFWRLFRQTRFHDYAQKSTKVPEKSHGVVRAVWSRDRLTYGDITVLVVDTPGFSPQAVSYVFSANGRRYAATGYLIYKGGKLLDLYSLQDAVEETKTRGYHGFAARAGQLITSLEKIRELRPGVPVPARGAGD